VRNPNPAFPKSGLAQSVRHLNIRYKGVSTRCCIGPIFAHRHAAVHRPDRGLAIAAEDIDISAGGLRLTL